MSSELPWNEVNSLEKRVLERPQAQDTDDEDEDGLVRTPLKASYTAKVGDVCFLALDQIVGRPCEAIRYQPTAIIVINSPVHHLKLRERVRAIWSSKDPRKKLFDSLLLDYSTEAVFNDRSLDGWGEGGNRKIEASMRLLYYFPEEAAPLISARLRSLDVRDAQWMGTWMQREVKNGVRTVDFIKAVAWSTHPEIKNALSEIGKRTKKVPPPPKQTSDPVEHALYYQSLLDSGRFENRAALARHLGVSRARVTQVPRRLN
jgi:hypothetical protein